MINNTEIFSAYEYLPSPLIIFSNKNIIYVNRKALELLELPKNITKETLSVFDFILPEFQKEILRRNNLVLKGQQLPPYGIKVRTRKNKVIDIETKSNAVKVKGRNYILTIFYEVTKRINLNEELSKSKIILDLIGKSKTDIVFKFDYYPEEKYSYVSDSFYSILGYRPDELYKNRSLMREIVHPEDGKLIPGTKSGYLNFIRDNNKLLSRYYKKNKKVVWLETIFNIVKDKNGNAVSLIGLSRDVSKEKEAETSLNITKEQLSLIANNAHDIIYFFTYHPQPKYLFISNSVENILGYKSNDFYRDPYFISKRIIGKEEFNNYENKAANDQLKNRTTQERTKYQVKKANGEVVWMEDHINPVYDDKGKISFLFGIVRNISELKEKERELDNKWSDYKLLLDQSPIAFFIHTKGVCLMCNKAAVDLLKVKSEKSIIGTFIVDYIVPEQRKRAIERMNLAAKGKEFDFLSYQVRDSKKNKINVEIKSVPITYNGTDCVLSLVKDISEREMFEKGKIKAELVEEHNKELLKEIELRKEVEKELLGEKKKLSSIFENSSHLVWTIDEKYRFTYLNTNFKNVFKNKHGYGPEIGNSVFDSVPKAYKTENRNTWLPLYKRAFNGERVIFERKDGEEIYVEVYLNPIYSSNGTIKEVSCMANDVSENKRNQKQLIEQSSRINTIFESGTQLLWTVDKEKKHTSFNNNYAKCIYDITGDYPKLGAAQNPKESNLIKEYADFWNKKYDEGFKGNSLEFTTERKFKGERTTVRHFYLHPIYDSKNEVVEISVLGIDITKEVFSQKEIISQSAKLNAIFEGSSHYVWTTDKNHNLTSFNRNYTELIKKVYNTSPMVGEPVNRGKMLANNEFVRVIEGKFKKAISGEKINFEIELSGSNNEKVFLDVFLNPVYDDNEIIEVSGIAHDISASKNNEEKIRQSLKEKEVLLKEVHHRVKNNMQIISSILNLQSSYISDENILTLLRESQNRIKTMAYIHESLYQNKTFSSINFNDYLAQLLNNIVHSYSVSPEKIKLHINCEKAILNLDTSIPLGLIINELVTNSIKHAFPATSKGNIAINLTTQNKFVLLTVEDSGVGIGPDISPESSGTLGLQLVYTLIDQISGKISFERIQPHGTRVNIRFLT